MILSVFEHQSVLRPAKVAGSRVTRQYDPMGPLSHRQSLLDQCCFATHDYMGSAQLGNESYQKPPVSCTFTADLFMIIPNWNPPKCPSAHGWIDGWWSCSRGVTWTWKKEKTNTQLGKGVCAAWSEGWHKSLTVIPLLWRLGTPRLVYVDMKVLTGAWYGM